MLLGFATVAINARALGAEGLGLIALLQASAAIMIGLFGIGSQQPMISLGRQAIEDRRKDRVGIIAGFAILLDTVAAISAGLCAIALIWLVPGLIGISDEVQNLALIYTIVIFFSGNAAANGIMRLLNRFHYIGATQVVNALLIFTATCLLFLSGATVRAYVVAYAVVQATTSVIHVLLALMLLKENGVTVRFSLQEIIRAGILSEFFAYAWTTWGTGTIDTLRRNADSLLLGVFSGPEMVGIYSVVKQLTKVFNKLAKALYSSVFPEIAVLQARKNHVGATVLRNRLLFYTFTVGGLFVCLAAFFGEFILRKGFGGSFSEGAATLTLMFAALVASISGGILSMFVQVFISPERLLAVFVVNFIVFMLVVPLTIFSYGLIGAPIGELVFGTGLWIGCWVSLRKILL
jgi:exopolysaccharide (amylovoran) exporter